MELCGLYRLRVVKSRCFSGDLGICPAIELLLGFFFHQRWTGSRSLPSSSLWSSGSCRHKEDVPSSVGDGGYLGHGGEGLQRCWVEHLFGAGKDSRKTPSLRTPYTSWLHRQGGQWHFKQKGSIGPKLGSVAGELQCCDVSRTSDGCWARGQGREVQIPGVLPSGLHCPFFLFVVLKWYILKLILYVMGTVLQMDVTLF